MATQQDAAQLYRQLQADAASADAWTQAADHATAYMHLSPRVDDDEAQAAYLADWRAKHPQTPAQPARWLAALGTLCLFGVGLGALLGGVYRFATRHDGAGLAAAVGGWLIVCLVYAAARWGRR